MNKKILSAVFLFSIMFPLSCCSNEGGTSSTHTHSFTHYEKKEPTCANPGSKEFWICDECREIFLEKQSGEVKEGGIPSEYFEVDDIRYLPIDSTKHNMKYVYSVDSTLNTDGMLGHYECDVCNKMFDSNKEEKPEEYFIIKKSIEEHPSIIDEILSSDAITSTWDLIRSNVSKWSHTSKSNNLTIPNNAGWQMTQNKFTDIDMKLKIDGCSSVNPDVSPYTCTKSFIIGGLVNPSELNPGEGIYARYPIGYLINVSNGTNSINKGIQIYEWTIDKVNTFANLKLIGRIIGDFNNVEFRIRIIDQTLTIFDKNNKPMFFSFGPNPNYTVTSLTLDNYCGGSIGVFSWTNDAKSEPNLSTFYIYDFYGKRLEDNNNIEEFVNNLLSTDKSISSSNEEISKNSSKWTLFNKYSHSISVANSYDKTSDIGSWKIARNYYDNFRLDFLIDGCTKINPKDNEKIGKSILLGVESKNDFFMGYSVTFYDNGKGSGGIAVKYHDGSLNGELLAFTTGSFDNSNLSIIVQNKQLRVLKDGSEISGGTSWIKRGNGISLEKYNGGHIGILSWDDIDSLFTLKNLYNLNDLTNEDYLKQDPSKRVNVFVFAGQSNMEGNTRAWDNYDSANYLRNYCNNSNHNFSELVGGYNNVKITYHNNYVVKTDSHKQNFSNESDPLFPKFVSTKVGQGLKWEEKPEMTYVGPELGFAEKINSQATSDKPIFIIKYASGGTYFGNQQLNWRSETSSNPRGYLYGKLVQYVLKSLVEIRKQGFIPIVKGIVWHQGESDGTSEIFANNYEQYLTNFVYDLKNDLATFAVENKAKNIAFIDAHVNAQVGTSVSYSTIINRAKTSVAKLSTKNFVIDTNKEGLNLMVGSAGFNGGDAWHYTIDSSIMLGNGYADVVLKNNLLNF